VHSGAVNLKCHTPEEEMSERTFTTLDGGKQSVGAPAVEALAGALRGKVFLPGEEGYETGRTLWNAMIDRRPGAVVRCMGTADVMRAVGFAADHGLLLAVRGGGHNIAGNAVCDGGLVLDLSAMRSVRVDPVSRTARVEAGALLSDFDKEAQAFGLATPLGINSTTGVAGLTLGGGYGWLTRKHGLTVDNLLSADVVTSDGRLVRASAKDEPDLFWAIRGGGGNFGVVTSFEFRLHEVGPEVLSGLIVHPLAEAPTLLRRYREVAAKAPEELTVWVVLRLAPPLPFLPAEWHGKGVMVLAACYAGDMKAGEAAVAPLRAIGEPIVDVIGPHPYAGWQQAFDPLLTPGARNYWKSHNFARIDDGLIDLLVEGIAQPPTPECEIFIAQLGGAPGRIDAGATAFAHRGAQFLMNVHTRWREPGDDARCIAWARDIFDRAAPHATGGVYVNFMPGDETARVSGAFGASYDRLAKVKAKYDPENRLRMNMNIRPAG
jgi:FAD/FMN-containing dehydrogenase